MARANETAFLLYHGDAEKPFAVLISRAELKRWQARYYDETPRIVEVKRGSDGTEISRKTHPLHRKW